MHRTVHAFYACQRGRTSAHRLHDGAHGGAHALGESAEGQAFKGVRGRLCGGHRGGRRLIAGVALRVGRRQLQVRADVQAEGLHGRQTGNVGE